MADDRLLPTQEQEHSKAAQQPRRGGGRLAELDVLRGFIMGVMALDHTVDLVCRCVLGRVAGSKNFNKEEWSGEPTYPSSNYGRNRFATRFITDLCAPCFCLLMGTGMVLLSESRRAKGWTNGQVLRFHLLRGVVLFFPCSVIIEHYGFSLPSLVWGTNTFDKLHAWVITSVLVCFSICMVCTALWLYALASAFGPGSSQTSAGPSAPGTSSPWRPRMLLTLVAGLATFVLSDRFVAHAAHAGTTADNASERYDMFTGLLFLPAQYGKLYVLYPVFPWLSLCFCGCALGWWLLAKRQDPGFSFLRLSAWGSAVCLSLFVLLRLLAGFGNFSQLSLDANTTLTTDGVRFFDVVKYPPSIAYAALTLGLDFLAISLCQLLDRAASKHGWAWQWVPWARKGAGGGLTATGVAQAGQSFSWGFWHPFLALGRSPLFFYLMHIWMLGLIGSCFRGGSPFWVVYIAWPFVVTALVPLCDRYSEFKQSKPVTSLWRLF